jgi:hypothetical protein
MIVHRSTPLFYSSCHWPRHIVTGSVSNKHYLAIDNGCSGNLCVADSLAERRSAAASGWHSFSARSAGVFCIIVAETGGIGKVKKEPIRYRRHWYRYITHRSSCTKTGKRAGAKQMQYGLHVSGVSSGMQRRPVPLMRNTRGPTSTR